MPKIKNYYEGDFARIYNIDVYQNSLLILSEGDFGAKNLSLYNNNLQIQTLQESSVKEAFL